MAMEKPNEHGYITTDTIAGFCAGNGYSLPDDYRSFLLANNGGTPTAPLVHTQGGKAVNVRYFCGLSGPPWFRLQSFLPNHHGGLPIATDDGGNFLVIAEDGHVYFEDHETGSLDHVASSFTELLSLLESLDAQSLDDPFDLVACDDLVSFRRLVDTRRLCPGERNEFGRLWTEECACHGALKIFGFLVDTGVPVGRSGYYASRNLQRHPEMSSAIKAAKLKQPR